jgi:hypothetical protein
VNKQWQCKYTKAKTKNAKLSIKQNNKIIYPSSLGILRGGEERVAGVDFLSIAAASNAANKAKTQNAKVYIKTRKTK